MAGVAFAATAPIAVAGTYTINDCPAAGGSADAGPLMAFGGEQGAKGSCGGGEGDWVGPRGSSLAPNSVGGVKVEARGGASLRGAKVWWYVPRSSSGASTYAIAAVNSGTIAESQTPLEQRGTPSVFSLPSGTTTLTLADYCANDDMGQGCSFGGAGATNLAVFGAQLIVEENRPPSGAATGGGFLSHEVLSGNESISFQASDADSGVREVELLVDGGVVGQQDYAASCSYTNFAACPGSESGSISWNTASVADGHHSLELDAVDAANNSSVLYSGSFSSVNSSSKEGPPTPERRIETPPSPSGASPSTLAAAPLSSTIVAQLRLSGATSITRTFADRAMKLTGRLAGMNGEPLAGASLVVLQQPIGGGKLEVVGSVITGPGGSFVAAVPPGPSRVIEIQPAPGSPYAASAVRVRETVRAGVVLKVTPRSTSPRGTILLRGRVEGGVPKGGVRVGLLVHYHGAWVLFRGPRTDETGHFESEYTFQGSVGRWPFQAEVPRGQEGLPYARGVSRVLVVRTG